MAGKQGQEPKPVGQRSISSMFSNSRISAGRSGNGRPVPLLEFLNRKTEKRTSIQGCVADAGLTPEVRERLDATRKDDNRSDKPYEKNERNDGTNGDLSCAQEPIWPFQNISKSQRSEGLQSFCIPKTKAAGIGIVARIPTRLGDDIGQCSVEECSTSTCQKETLLNKHRRSTQVCAGSSNSWVGERIQHKVVVSQVLDRNRNRARTPPRLEIFSKQSASCSAMDAGCDPINSEGRHNLNDHLLKNASHHYQSCNVDFIDLTKDEDPAVGRLEGEDHLFENTELDRKRKRSQGQGTMEMCPVCNELFPPHMLQAHVESELDALEMLEIDSASEAHANSTGGNESHYFERKDGSAGSWEDHTGFPGCPAQFKKPSINSRPRQSLLVLGDEPKCRRQPNFGSHKNKRPNRSATFNHYADGAGWWDEGGVGVDAEAVGSASVWEGLGSMSFGGML